MSPEDYTNNGGYKVEWKVTACIVLDERAWITDDENIFSHNHSKRLILEVEADSHEEALKTALHQVKDKKWASLMVSKEYAPRRYHSYFKSNEELYNKAYVKYIG